MRAPSITLYHVPFSHFSEKARWALDLKRVAHRRRALFAGSHVAIAYALTRGRHDTVPLLTVDGRAIGDSSAILAELESRFPDPPLYPADAGERRRALELEDWLDEELGAYIRRLAYHEVVRDRDALRELTHELVPWQLPGGVDVAGRVLARVLDARFDVRGEDLARTAERKLLEALDRLDAELDGREHLCGEAFSVADLTAASLLYPLVLPPEGPWRPAHFPDSWMRRRERLSGRRAFRFVEEMFARHRTPGA